jgi:hypothetical protein
MPCPALLEEPGLVYNQNCIIRGERREQIVAHDVAQRVGIPPATAKDRLLPPRARIARRFRAHPAGLAPLVAQKPIQKQAC